MIKTLFLDIGGVLLTDGWPHESRRKAAVKFGLDYSEMQERHHITFDTYEEGKLTFDEYLTRVVFYQKRQFTRAMFKIFIFEQSEPYTNMIKLFIRLKTEYKMNIICLGGRVTGYALSWDLVRAFLNAKFNGGKRFKRRLAKVELLEKKRIFHMKVK